MVVLFKFKKIKRLEALKPQDFSTKNQKRVEKFQFFSYR